MRFLPTVGLYWKSAGAGSLKSGVSYSTQPTDIPYNALAFEQESVFEFVRMSGTATVGSFVYYTGTAMNYVCCSGTGGIRPAGVLMVSPTASGVWTWIQKYGKNTSIQATSTFSVATPSNNLFVDGGSAALNLSAAVSGAAVGSGSVGTYVNVGQNLSVATGSQTVGFLTLL